MAEYTEAAPKSTAIGGVAPPLQAAAAEEQHSEKNDTAAGSGESTRRNSGSNSDDKTKEDTAIPVEKDGVDVERAKQDFAQVQRTYSRRSSLSRQVSRRSTRGEPQFDPEKGGDHGEEFDLLEFLVSMNKKQFWAFPLQAVYVG